MAARMQSVLRSSALLSRSSRFTGTSRINLPPRTLAQVRSMAAIAQTPIPAGGAILTTIAKDHREIYEYYNQYLSAAGDKDAQERWSRQLIWEIARHSIGEEIVVYPLLEKHLGAEGKALADGDRNDHQYVKDGLYKLEKMNPSSPEATALLKDVIDHLHEHAQSEETNDLPKLEAAIPAADNEKAAKSFTMTKKFVPTRSHPSAPAHPPMETVAGFLATPMDKLKDMFAKFPTSDMKAEAQSNIPK